MKRTILRTCSLLLAATLLGYSSTYAQDASQNLLENADALAGFNIYPSTASESAQEKKGDTNSGAKSLLVTTAKDPNGTLTANVCNKAMIPVEAGKRVRCSFRAKGLPGQTATVVLYYFSTSKQQITGVWPKFPTGLNLTSDWQNYEIEYTIQGNGEDPGVKAAVEEKAGGVVGFLQCAILLAGEGTVELADIKLERVE
jgi:hypothetical protein